MAVKTYVKSQRVQLSKNFNSWEFRCGLGRGCNCTTTLIDDKLAEILQKIRDYFGAKVTITSGYRCPSYNLSIGGATGSYHSRGMAADITVEGVPPRAVAAYAQSIGVLGIGLYEGADGSFVHVDTRIYKSYWYGKKEEPRSSFGGASDYEKYANKITAASNVQATQTQTAATVDTGNTYTVKSGDTLAKIAAKYSGVTYQAIATLNGLKAPYTIFVGQKLRIPGQPNAVTTPASTVPYGEYASADYDASPDFLWKFFMEKIGNAFGVAGLLGNLNAESNLIAANLQITYRTKLGYTSQSYTEAVDSGKYNQFAGDSAGYGIAQWTDSSRKTALHSFAKMKSASIGNRRMQAEFLMEELTGRFTSVLNTLKTATSVRQASNAVLMKFECPYDQGQSVQNSRAAFGEMYYKKFSGETGSASGAIPYSVTVKADLLNVRNGPGTSNSILRRVATGTACTIVEEKDGWGRLDSGGWVCLMYTTK